MEFEFQPQRVTRLREEQNMSRNRFAICIGTSGQHVKLWEDGDSLPVTSSLLAMCNRFDVEPGYFFANKKAHKQSECAVEVDAA